MRKYFILIFFLLLLPFMVEADDLCNDENITIKDITLKKTTGYTEILEDAEVIDNKIDLDIKMYEFGDTVEYQFTVENGTNHDYVMDTDNLIDENNVLDYQLKAEDNNYTVKKNSEKDFTLSVTYENEVNYELYRGGLFDASSDYILPLRSPSIINPLTGSYFVFFILTLVLISIGFAFIKNKKLKKLYLLGVLLIPFSTSATCSYHIILDTNVVIRSVSPNPCTYDGELVQGAEYTNGQYTYHYMQESGGSNWYNITFDGWGVALTDRNSTEPVTTKLCTSINDKPIVSMNNMFYYSNATSIDTSSFDTSNVIRMGYMFYGSQGVESLDLNGFDTSNVNYMSLLFYNTPKLVNLNLSGWDFSNINRNYISSEIGIVYLPKLEKIDLSGSKYKGNISYAFSSLGSATDSPFQYLILNDVDTSEVTNMNSLFANSKTIKNLNLSSFDTSNVTDMSYMFEKCTNLEEIDLSHFNTSNVTNMNKMFSECTSIENLDLSHFDTSKVENISEIVYKANSLININFSGWDFSNVSSNLISTSTGIAYINTLKKIDFSRAKFKGDMSYGFARISENGNYTIDEIIFDDVDTSEVTNMNRLFVYSKAITSLDLSDFDTSNVTNMSYMFSYAENLEEINLGDWDTSKVENMEYMFEYVKKVKSLDVSNFDADNLKNIQYMFYNCHNLEELNISNIVTPKLTSANYMISSSTSLKSVIADNWEFSSNTTLYQAFDASCTIEYLSMKNWILPASMFNFASYSRLMYFKHLDVSNWNFSKTTNCQEMFKEIYSVQKIDGMDTWKNTSNITNWGGAFKYNYALKEIDLSAIDFSKVTSVTSLFDSDRALQKINMGDFNALVLENTAGMFSSLQSVEEITFDSISTPNLKTANNMFSGLPKLKSLDLRGMNVSQTTTISSMFSSDTSLEYLDLSTFDTSHSPSMSGMFQSCTSLTTAYAKTQADADRFNATENKASNVTFVVKS